MAAPEYNGWRDKVNQVVASEQGCGKHRVVGTYPHCMAHGAYPYGGVCHSWMGSLIGDQIPVFPWHPGEPHQVNTKYAKTYKLSTFLAN